MQREAHTVAIPQPAAGAAATYVVRGAGPELLVACSAVLVASVAVANRMAQLRVVSAGGAELARLVAPSGNIAAGLTLRASWGYGLGRGSDTLPTGALVTTQALPLLVLPEGSMVIVAVDNIDAGDQLSGLSVTVMRDGDDEGAQPERAASLGLSVSVPAVPV